MAQARTRPQAISVVVLTYDWPQALRRVLDTLAMQRLPAHEVIVSEDGSDPRTQALIADLAPGYPTPLRHLRQEDRGFRAARARNRGIAVARGDYVLLLDGDMLLHPDFIADHAALAEPGFFLQGGRIKADRAESERLLAGGVPRFSPRAPAHWRDFDGLRRHYAFRAPWLARWKARSRHGGRVMSCNMSFWRNDLLRVNGFDERMEGYGAEDRELAARLQNAGLRRRALKWAALAVHLWHPSRAPPDVDDMRLPNNRLFRATRERRLTWCEHGIGRHAELLTPAEDGW